MLITTFIFGFVSGVILYLYNNASGGNGGGGGTIIQDDSAVSITAYRYGGCERAGGCAQYRISGDGAYTYIIRNSVEGETRFDNSLNAEEKKALFKVLKETDLQNVGKNGFTGNCPIEHDGTAYRYTIEYNEERYNFDTCKQELDTVPLFVTLKKYFEMLATTYSIP